MRLVTPLLLLPFIFGSLSCSSEKDHPLQGYVEADYVRVAAPFAGNLALLNVKRGTEVSAGAALFSLEQENEAAARREAAEQLRRTEAQLQDLKSGKRGPELETIRAQREQATATLKLSEVQLRRQQQLVAANFVSKERVDEARSAVERDRARVAELTAQLNTANLAARPEEISAAAAQVEASRAALAQADWKLAQKSVKAPMAALVSDTLYTQGEWVPAGSPVMTLLPPQNIKIRFFVPEALVGSIRIGQRITINCDGCKAATAEISFIASQPEYTPPVIYSKDSRSKLVFLIEAQPATADAANLHPGQPVDIKL